MSRLSGQRPLLLTAFALVALLLTASCSGSTASMAGSNVPVAGRTYKVLGPAKVTVNWFSYSLLFYAWPGEPVPLTLAMKRLLRKKRSGQALTNIRYTFETIPLTLITWHRLHMQADVIRLDP